MADSNLITKADLARVREVDFTLQFTESIKKLVEALGVTRKQAKQAGTVLKTYKATGTLEDGEVAEGDTIPLSKYIVEAVTYKEITLKKYRKATSAEAIVDRGYDQAVNMTTDRMLKDAQKTIRTDLFASLADGNGRAHGTTFQSALAQAWGQLQVLFEDDEIASVFFMNPLDVADYLATASITVQTAFGMSYIENFLGLGTVFLNSSVPQGQIYATAKDNVVMYYVPVNGADLGEAFEFTSDETGYIGIHELPNYSNMTCEDVVMMGIEFFAEKPDGVVVANIGSSDVAVVYTEDELNQMTVSELKTLASEHSITLTATTKADIITEILASINS